MSRNSFADDQEVGSQQEIHLVNAGKTLLKKNSFLVSTTDNAAIEACVVDDQDVESQQPSLLNASNAQRRWRHLVYLVQKAHQKLVSEANSTVMDTQLEVSSLKSSLFHRKTTQHFHNNSPPKQLLSDRAYKFVSLQMIFRLF